MVSRLGFVCLAFSLSLICFRSGSAYDHLVEKKVFTLSSFTTVGGDVLKDVRFGYETYGDLNAAKEMKITDIAIGDRVLVALEPGRAELRRIIVMSAADIARRNEAERQDWTRRGVSGIVASKDGNDIKLKMRSMQGEAEALVTVGPKTTYKRYAPDSVKFADARASKLDEINVGDQLRARGQKSEDGLKVGAQDVVFGTFQTRAGAIVAVDETNKAITVKELGTNKPLVIKLTADSQLKEMPDFAAMFAGRGGVGFATGGAAPAGWGVGRMGGPGTAGGRAGAGFDLAKMLERMPATTLDKLKAGQMIVVSSTKGTTRDQVTAITLLANADLLIQMASAQGADNWGGSRGGANAGMGVDSGGMTGGFGLEMPSIIP